LEQANGAPVTAVVVQQVVVEPASTSTFLVDPARGSGGSDGAAGLVGAPSWPTFVALLLALLGLALA